MERLGDRGQDKIPQAFFAHGLHGCRDRDDPVYDGPNRPWLGEHQERFGDHDGADLRKEPRRRADSQNYLRCFHAVHARSKRASHFILHSLRESR
jgi:hypothetical protein